MDKKPNKGIIAAAAVLGVVVCILVGVLIGLAVINGGGTDELVTDAFCEMVKDDGEKNYYRIPKLNIKKDWAEEVNEKIYDTLYDEYEKGKVLYDGSTPIVSEMGYEWAEKDGIVSITVQLKNAFTGRYEFFVFNIDTNKEREITDEELIEAFGYDKTEYFGMMKDVLRDIYNSEIPKLGETDYIYDSWLEEASKDESLENSLAFITDEGKLNVILPVFSADAKENVDAIVDIETGEKQDYFTFDEEYKEVKPEFDMSSEANSEDGVINGRLEITDAEIVNLLQPLVVDSSLLSFSCSNPADIVVATTITSLRGARVYADYFDDYTYGGSDLGAWDNWTEESDPYNLFPSGYVKLPEENVKWVCENIFNVPYSPDYENTYANYNGDTQIYSHDGYIYRKVNFGSFGGAIGMELGGKIRLDDGRYELVLSGMSSSKQDYIYWRYVVDVREIDGIRYVTYYHVGEIREPYYDVVVEAASVPEITADRLEITDADILELKENIIDKYLLTDFDYRKTKTGALIRHIIGDCNISVYAQYFDDYVHYITPPVGKNSAPWVPDPREHAMSREQYLVVSEENLKWICENIYHVEYNYEFEKEPATDYAYAEFAVYEENGKIYRETYSYNEEKNTTSFVRSTKLDDGRYEIVFRYDGDFDETMNGYLSVCVDSQMIEGEHQFTFYSINRLNEREVNVRK